MAVSSASSDTVSKILPNPGPVVQIKVCTVAWIPLLDAGSSVSPHSPIELLPSPKRESSGRAASDQREAREKLSPPPSPSSNSGWSNNRAGSVLKFGTHIHERVKAQEILATLHYNINLWQYHKMITHMLGCKNSRHAAVTATWGQWITAFTLSKPKRKYAHNTGIH